MCVHTQRRREAATSAVRSPARPAPLPRHDRRFVTITACGTLFTGALAYDGYRQGTGWLPLTNKH